MLTHSDYKKWWKSDKWEKGVNLKFKSYLHEHSNGNKSFPNIYSKWLLGYSISWIKIDPSKTFESVDKALLSYPLSWSVNNGCHSRSYIVVYFNNSWNSTTTNADKSGALGQPLDTPNLNVEFLWVSRVTFGFSPRFLDADPKIKIYFLHRLIILILNMYFPCGTMTTSCLLNIANQCHFDHKS